MQDNGFEVRHEENLREHYAAPCTAGATTSTPLGRGGREVGLGRAKVWALYMAGSRLGFERRTIELHQVLGVRVDDHGDSGMPLRPDWGV